MTPQYQIGEALTNSFGLTALQEALEEGVSRCAWPFLFSLDDLIGAGIVSVTNHLSSEIEFELTEKGSEVVRAISPPRWW